MPDMSTMWCVLFIVLHYARLYIPVLSLHALVRCSYVHTVLTVMNITQNTPTPLGMHVLHRVVCYVVTTITV